MNKSSIFGFAVLFLLPMFQAAPVSADVRDFDLLSFRRAELEGRLIVLDFHTIHCPKCRPQSPLIEKVITDRRARDVSAFLVDFEKGERLRHQYDVEYRTTVIFLHKGHEVARVAGQIDHDGLEAAIRAGLDKALGQMK